MNRSMRLQAHAVLFSVFVAALCFSWALATSETAPAVRATASPRGAATQLRISNPFLLAGVDPLYPNGGDVAADPAGFDLGDAYLGSQIVRFVNALGGFQPYTFLSSSIGSNSSPGLRLDPSGLVIGAVPVGGPVPATFTTEVLDAAGSVRTGYFRLGTMAPGAGGFRFALDRLPAAQVGVDYITTLDAVGSDPSTTFYSVVGGSALFNGAAIAGLEYVGLTLSDDGTLAGRPLESGTLSFTARATSGQAVARNRPGTAPDQPLTVQIAGISAVQSAMGTTSAAIKGDSRKPGKGSLSLKALLNLDGNTLRDFANGFFGLRLGGAVFGTKLNSSGQSRTGNLRVSLDAIRGILSVQLRNTDMTAVFPPASLPDLGTQTVVFELEIGSTYRAAEPVEFDVRSSGQAFKMQYRLGQQRQLGGLFQIYRVKAAEFGSGTVYKTNFLISHVKGRSAETFGNGLEATVFVGTNFFESVPLRRGQGRFSPPGLRSLRIDARHKLGTLETYPLTEDQTGIPPPSQGLGQMQTFLFSMDLTTDTLFFSGDASQRIFPVRLRR